MTLFHLATESGKNAKVGLSTTNPTRKTRVSMLTPTKEEVETESVCKGTIPIETQGYDLINGDPEIDLTRIGKKVPRSNKAYVKEKTNSIERNFETQLITYLPNEEIKSKDKFVQRKCNINDINPVKIVKRLPLASTFEKFVFHNHYALLHDDGVKFDFLYNLAKELHEKQEMALVGAGPKGNLPLVFLDGGTPCRGFLYGEVTETSYKLLLLLSKQELKLPEQNA
jgi:hypothetical protein